MDAGYGSLKEVKEMNSREVLQALNFLSFKADFERTYADMMKGEVTK